MVAQKHGMAVSAPKAAFGLAPAATMPRWQERTVSSKDGFRRPNVGNSLSAHPAVPLRVRSSQEGGLRGLKATIPRSGNGGAGGRRWAMQMMLGACIAFISVPFAPMAAFAKGGAGQEAASGGLAGFTVHVVKQTVLYPIDTIKVRIQAEKADPTRPLWTRGDLFKGCYKGFLVPLVINSPASAVFFAVKDSVKSELKAKIGNPLSTVAAILAAQVPYWLIRQPAEAIKVRSQISASVEGMSRWDAIKGEFQGLDPRQPGALAALFTGYWSNIAYAFPADATKFVCYDVLKQAVGGKPKDPLKAAALGAFSTSIAQVFTTPLDVGRNRIMSSRAKGQVPASGESGGNIVSVCNSILKEEGIAGLFLGLTPRIGRAIVSGAIQFATYETVKGRK